MGKYDEQKKRFATNMKRLISASGKTQKEVAAALGVPYSTVNNWCTGTSMPKTSTLIDDVAQYFNVTRSDLMDAPGTPRVSLAVRIPVYGRVAAGIPLEAIQDITDYEELDPKKFNPEHEYFALTIHGNSMEPKMSEGDVVVVRRQEDAESGDICIVAVNGMEATCKRIRKHHDGIELVALNPSYGPMFYTAEQCQTLPVRILGKVVELRAKF